MDNPKDQGYNPNQSEDAIRITHEEVKNLPVLNNTACDHRMRPDHSDETDDYIAYKCINPRCGRGMLIAKDKQENVTPQ